MSAVSAATAPLSRHGSETAKWIWTGTAAGQVWIRNWAGAGAPWKSSAPRAPGRVAARRAAKLAPREKPAYTISPGSGWTAAPARAASVGIPISLT